MNGMIKRRFSSTGFFVVIAAMLISIAAIMIAIIYKVEWIWLFLFVESVGFINCLIDMIEDSKKEYEEKLAYFKSTMHKGQVTRIDPHKYYEQRKIVHDYRNHLLAIEGLLKNNNLEEAQEYIKGLFDEKRYNCIFETGNSAIDALLNEKYYYAKTNNISMEVRILDITNLKVPNYAAVAILSNAIDNAINACVQSNVFRHISLSVTPINQGMLIYVKNTSPKVTIKNGKHIVNSSKKEGGLGLKIIEETLNEYGGDYSIAWDEGWFQFTAMIPEVPRRYN